MNVSEALLHAVKDRGATEVFGIPGDFSLPFFKVLEETAILPLFTLSHEPAVGFAADAAARIRKSPGVAAVTYGAGALNMVNAVAAAYAEKSRLVVISSAPSAEESARGLLLHHQAKTLDSQFKIYEQITCAQARLDDPERAPAQIAETMAEGGRRSLPVYFEIPRDVLTAPCGSVPPDPQHLFDPDALSACADEILARLQDAQNPVMLAGVELRRFSLEQKAAELGERLGVPVVTSFMGRGLLSNTASPPIGTYLGLAGKPDITDLVERSDGLLMLGVIPSDTNFGVSGTEIDRKHAVHAFDGQVQVGYHHYLDVPLPALIDALLARTGNAQGEATTPISEQRAPATPAIENDPTANDILKPMDIAHAVNDLMARNAPMPIASDVGDCLFTAMDMTQTAFLAPGYYAGMGFGVPAGIGIQAATGRRPIILVGDGAFQMTGWELGNCRRYGLDPIVLVFNNRSWEMLRVFQSESKFNDLDDWNFANIAESLGGHGVRVTTRSELSQALADAVAARGRFQLIEIMIERGVISETLSRFVAAVSRLRDPARTA